MTGRDWIAAAPEMLQDVLQTARFRPWFKVTDFTDGTLSAEVQSALRHSGSYVIGAFDEAPPDDPLDERVGYIGMTKGRSMSLGKRLGQFVTVVTGGVAPHAGGWNWRKAALAPANWIRVAPNVDMPQWTGTTQSWSIWPEVVEKALLMAYADRHGRFPYANKEGWDLPDVTDELVEAVEKVMRVSEAEIVEAARLAVPLIVSALGYRARTTYLDAGKSHPSWLGAWARLSGKTVWLGRELGKHGQIGIWHSDETAFHTEDIRKPGDSRDALSKVLHAWHTSREL